MVGNGYPPQKLRKVEENVNIEKPLTSLMDTSIESPIIGHYWRFPVCCYSFDCMQKLEKDGENFKCSDCDIVSREFSWHFFVFRVLIAIFQVINIFFPFVVYSFWWLQWFRSFGYFCDCRNYLSFFFGFLIVIFGCFLCWNLFLRCFI